MQNRAVFGSFCSGRMSESMNLQTQRRSPRTDMNLCCTFVNPLLKPTAYSRFMKYTSEIGFLESFHRIADRPSKNPVSLYCTYMEVLYYLTMEKAVLQGLPWACRRDGGLKPNFLINISWWLSVMLTVWVCVVQGFALGGTEKTVQHEKARLQRLVRPRSSTDEMRTVCAGGIAEYFASCPGRRWSKNLVASVEAIACCCR